MSLETDARPFSVSAQFQAINPPEKQTYETNLRPDYEIKQVEKITVVGTEKPVEVFLERQNFPLNPLEYPRTGNDPGLVLIFNQESFDDKSYRLGSRRDVNEIIICMSRLGFNINENHIFNDLNRDDILKVIRNVTEQNLSQVNSLIIFFLTHGDSFNRLHAHDYSLDASELWKDLKECEDLKNKPKMFIFQACKGDNFSTVANESEEKIELVPQSTFNSNYIGPDMLVVYSTAEGNVSFRDPKTGTWFIQELCKNFSAYGRRDDVVSLIMRTSKCLCRNYYYHDKFEIKKQMPVFVSTLRKKFYLNRYKDRNFFIKLVQDQESIKGRLKNLETKINELIQEKEKKTTK